MKKTFLIILAFVVSIISCSGQGDWNNIGKFKTSQDLKSVGLWVSGGVSDIYRNTDVLPALGEGNFEAGISFGKKTAFVIRSGVYTQSDFFTAGSQNINSGNEWGGYYQQWGYNPSCGCYPQPQQASSRFRYVRFGHFQVGFSNQGKKHGVRVTAGIAGFNYRIPVVDSLGNETAQVVIPNATALAIGFDFKQRLGKDLLSARLQSYTDVDRIAWSGSLGTAEIDYLVGIEQTNQKIYAGIGVSYKKHVVSGHEYSVRALLQFGHNEIPIGVRVHFGVAYNPLPSEGVGWQAGVMIEIDRFAKSIYR